MKLELRNLLEALLELIGVMRISRFIIRVTYAIRVITVISLE
jgi:hypothetical protein